MAIVENTGADPACPRCAGNGEIWNAQTGEVYACECTTIRRHILVAAERVYKYFGRHPDLVIVGGPVARLKLEAEAQRALRFLRPPAPSDHIDEDIAGQYLGIPVAFVGWQDGFMVLPCRIDLPVGSRNAGRRGW